MRIEWNGGKLTKKRALFLCWKLWQWLAENPSKDKGDWPKWKSNGGGVVDMGAHCPCCEFPPEDEFDSPICSKCPLVGFWDAPRGGSQLCLGNDAQFYKWLVAGDNAETIKYAKRIAAAAKRRYEKLS